MRARFAQCVIGLVVFGVQVVAAGAGDGTSGAAERFVKTTGAAVTYAPMLRAALEDLAADEAGATAEIGAGTPWMEYQSEGLGSSFSRRPNAQDTLRVGVPFNLPWQGTRARRYGHEVMTRSLHEGRAAALEIIAAAGGEWLRIAALSERISVVSERLTQLDRALLLQQKRLDLGEVSGTEVMQLKFARAAEASLKAALEAEAEACRSRLQMYCGDECAPPESGDLEELLGATNMVAGKSVDYSVEDTPWIRSVESDHAIAEARTEMLKWTVWGRPELVAEWESFPTMNGVPGFDAVGLQVSVPLPFGREGRMRKEEATARARAAEARVKAQKKDLGASAAAAAASVAGAESRLSALAEVLADLDNAGHSLGEQFRLGAISYLVFIDGLSRLDEIQLEAIDARETFLMGRLTLAILLDDADLLPIPKPTSTAPVEDQS